MVGRRIDGLSVLRSKIAVPIHFGGMPGTEGADRVFKQNVGKDIEVVPKIGK